MELTIKELAPYLPYGLKVQYEGIINGKEIGDYKRQWNKDHKIDGLFIDYSDYKEPEPIKGLKIGFIKEVRISLKGITYRIGRKGLQTHYSTNGFKPLLRPLSELTKLITHNGETFVPIERIKESQHHLFLREDLINPIDGLQYSEVQKLLEWHFDIFSLLNNGLAIDLNTIQQ